MLTFRNTNIFFAALFSIALVSNALFHVPVYIYIIILFIYSLLLFYGSYFIQSGFYIKAICSSTTNKKQISFSFDDGPAGSYTPEILRVLKEHHIETTFFCIGNRIEGNEEILKAINQEDHIIGNHSYSHHFWFDLFSSKKMLADMKMMSEKVKETIGLTPKLFRPPYGVTNPNLKKAIINGNYITIGWSIRSMDTVIKDKSKLLKKIKKSINPGAIILFHDTSKTTLAILPELIKYVKAEGFEIIRLDKMLNLQPYE